MSDQDYEITKIKKQIIKTKTKFIVEVEHGGECEDFDFLFETKYDNTTFNSTLIETNTETKEIETEHKRSIKHKKAENLALKALISEAITKAGFKYRKQNEEFGQEHEFSIRGNYFNNTYFDVMISHPGHSVGYWPIDLEDGYLITNKTYYLKEHAQIDYNLKILVADPDCQEKVTKYFESIKKIAKLKISDWNYSEIISSEQQIKQLKQIIKESL